MNCIVLVFNELNHRLIIVNDSICIVPSFWFLPSNETGFRLSDALHAQDGKVYWRNNNSLKVGDMVLIYSTRLEQRVKYEMGVVEAKIPTAQRPFDQKQFWNKQGDFEKAQQISYYCLLSLQKAILDQSLSMSVLRDHGVKGYIQGPRKVEGELLRFILETIG